MRYMVFTMLALVWAGPSFAADDKWQQAILRLQDHPEVAAYARAAEAATSFAAGERGLPDPMIFVENQDIASNAEEKMLGFSQSFPPAGARDAAAAGYRAESDKSRLLAGYAQAVLQARLITVLADLEKTDKLEKIAREKKTLLALAEKSAKGRIAANRGEISDVSLLRAQMAEVDLTLADLEEERHDLHNMLAYITGSKEKLAAPKTVPLTWKDDVDNTWPVLIADAEKKKSETEVKLQEASFRPALSFEGSAIRMRGGDNSGTLRLGVSVPLWASNNQTPKLRGAKAVLSARDSDTQKMRREMEEKLSHLQMQISISKSKSKIIARKIAETEKTAAARKRAYEAGKSELADVVMAKIDALEERAAFTREEARRTALAAAFNSYFAEDKGGANE